MTRVLEVSGQASGKENIEEFCVLIPLLEGFVGGIVHGLDDAGSVSIGKFRPVVHLGSKDENTRIGAGIFCSSVPDNWQKSKRQEDRSQVIGGETDR